VGDAGVPSPVHLSLAPAHRRGHGNLSAAPARGEVAAAEDSAACGDVRGYRITMMPSREESRRFHS
jgi:hypothetical protein